MISYRSSQAWFWRLSVSVGLILIFSGCPRKNDDCTTCPPARLITLSSSRVSCTEAWLKLSVANLEKTRISLEQDGNAFADLTLGVFDTTLYYTGLTPGRTYAFQAFRQPSKDESDVSEPLTVRTMDTTSHEFTWTVTTLGLSASGFLNDVSIVNDTLAFAVGEVFEKDSTGHYDLHPYTFAKWNGKEWILQKVAVYELRVIKAFSESDIWVSSSAPSHWNGVAWTEYDINGLFDGWPSEMWGSSSSDLYMVGTNGSIIHFNGSSWQKISSGTNLTLTGLCGYKSGKGNGNLVLAIGSTPNTQINNRLLAMTSDGVKDTLGWTSSVFGFSVWFSEHTPIYVGGNGVWSFESGSWRQIYSRNYMNIVTGIGENSLFCAGSFSEIAHFNGSTWREYPELYNPTAVIRSVAATKSLFIAVGDAGDLPLTVIGRFR